MDDHKYIMITSSEDFEKYKTEDAGVVMVDFYADWCGPCKMIAPVIAELATEYEGKATILKVDVDQANDVAWEYNITSIPTIVMLVNGKEVDRKIWAMSKEQYSEWLDENIAKLSGDGSNDSSADNSSDSDIE